MKADKYYGEKASQYDAARCHSLRWAREQQAIADFVFSGPVLDVPIGTGRYMTIYRDKGLKVTGADVSADMMAQAKAKYPDIDLHRASVLDLPFRDKQFATVVCTRLLDWLYPAEMERAVGELRRMANIIVVSIRHGAEGERVNYTHDLSRFYAAIGGLFICDRRLTEITRDGTEEIFRLRPPMWSDVVRQFDVPDKIFANAADEIARIAAQWTGVAWPHQLRIAEDTIKVSAEYWPVADLVSAIDWMAEHDPSYETNLAPRMADGPVTVMRASGSRIVLDGRRRINGWRGETGRRPVLVLEPA